MPLPGNRTLNTADLTAYAPSCGASPVAAYERYSWKDVAREDPKGLQRWHKLEAKARNAKRKKGK